MRVCFLTMAATCLLAQSSPQSQTPEVPRYTHANGLTQRAYGPFMLQMGESTIILDDVAIWSKLVEYGPARLALHARIASYKGGEREWGKLRLTYTCPAPPAITTEFQIERIDRDQTEIDVPIYGMDHPACEPPSISLTVSNPGFNESEERARQEAYAKAAKEAQARAKAKAIAEQKRLADEIAERERRRALMPKLRNGRESVFIGADQKCSQQFIEALAMTGLEQRKRLADLVTYGCGFVVPGGTAITRGTKSGLYERVTITEGDYGLKSGWVPSSWIYDPVASATKGKAR